MRSPRLRLTRKDRIKQRAGPALYRVMAPGEQIAAGVFAVAGLDPRAAAGTSLALAAPTVGGGVAAALQWAALAGSGRLPALPSLPWVFASGAAALLAVPLPWLNRPVFLAVTDRQAICYRLGRSGHLPGRLLFAVPLAGIRVSRYRSGGWFASLRCEAPGPGGRQVLLRLAIHRNWFPDLDALLTALRVAGAVLPG